MESLYNFPKEMLIKLLVTIREQTEKEIRKDVGKETEMLLLKLINKDYNSCYKCESCNSILIVGNEGSIIYTNGEQSEEGFKQCDYCSDFFCSKHFSSKEISSNDDLRCYYCDNLIDIYVGELCKTCSPIILCCKVCNN